MLEKIIRKLGLYNKLKEMIFKSEMIDLEEYRYLHGLNLTNMLDSFHNQMEISKLKKRNEELEKEINKLKNKLKLANSKIGEFESKINCQPSAILNKLNNELEEFQNSESNLLDSIKYNLEHYKYFEYNKEVKEPYKAFVLRSIAANNRLNRKVEMIKIGLMKADNAYRKHISDMQYEIAQVREQNQTIKGKYYKAYADADTALTEELRKFEKLVSELTIENQALRSKAKE